MKGIIFACMRGTLDTPYETYLDGLDGIFDLIDSPLRREGVHTTVVVLFTIGKVCQKLLHEELIGSVRCLPAHPHFDN
jgi:hypothetical protein